MSNLPSVFKITVSLPLFVKCCLEILTMFRLKKHEISIENPSNVKSIKES